MSTIKLEESYRNISSKKFKNTRKDINYVINSNIYHINAVYKDEDHILYELNDILDLFIDFKSEMYNENHFGYPIPINNSQITNINDDKKLQYCLIILYRIICDYYTTIYKKDIRNTDNKDCLNKLIKFHNEIFEIEYQKIEPI
jgi:hypothetical protein